MYTHLPLFTDSVPCIVVPQNGGNIISPSERRPVDYLTEYAPPDISPSILAAALSRIHNTPQNSAYVRSNQPDGTATSRARDSTKTSHEKRVQEAIRLQGRLKLLTIANNKSHIPPSNNSINILNAAAANNNTTAEKAIPHNSIEHGLRAEVSKSVINEFLVVPPPPAAGPERLQYMTSLESTTKGGGGGGGGGKTVTIAGKTTATATPVQEPISIESSTPFQPTGGYSDDGRTDGLHDKYGRKQTVYHLHSRTINHAHDGTMGGVNRSQTFPGTPLPAPTPAVTVVPTSKPVAPPNTFTNYSGPSTMNCFGEKIAQEGIQRRDKYALQVQVG